MGLLQALMVAINISRMVADLAKQAQSANGSKLAEIMNAINSLTAEGISVLELIQRLSEADRVQLTDEEKQLVRDADDAASDAQKRVLGAMNDEAGDPVEQGKRRDQARREAREAPEFKSARTAAEERGKSR